MKKIKIFLLSIASSIGAVAADIDVTPGKLESLLEDATKNETELKLRGAIDARDIAALEHLSSAIKSLDMGGVEVRGLTMPSRKYFGRTLFGEGEIPAYSFFQAKVEAVVLPSNVASISEGAFAGSQITSITVPEGVTSIGDYAFYGCPDLKSISLPSTLKEIGKGAFGNCMALETVDFSRTGLTEIPERALAGSVNVASVILPSGITRIGREAFSHTKISTLNLGQVNEFDAYALSGMAFLTTLTVNPDASIGEGLLMDDVSLVSLSAVPETMPDYFAANCTSFNSETAVNSVSSVGRYALANTRGNTLILPASLVSVNRGAISGMSGLETIDATELGGMIPAADETSFEGLVQPDINLVVNKNYADSWRQDPAWGKFNIVEVDESGMADILDSSADGLLIGSRNGIIFVESAAGIEEVRIYAADGRLAFVSSPGTERVEVDMASLPAGIVVVAATDSEGHSRTLSVLVR